MELVQLDIDTESIWWQFDLDLALEHLDDLADSLTTGAVAVITDEPIRVSDCLYSTTIDRSRAVAHEVGPAAQPR